MSLTGSAETTNNLSVLKGKIRSLSPYAVDKTLSVDGAAADAKTVGDALEKKVSTTDIVDNLTTKDGKKPLSANQGVALKKSITDLTSFYEELKGDVEQSFEEASTATKKAQTTAESAQESADEALEKLEGLVTPDGSVAMTGDLNMGEHKVSGVAEPTNDTDAATKKYVDSKKFTADVVLRSSAWASFTDGTAPFTQKIAVEGITEDDEPHYGIVYSSDDDTRKAEKKAFSFVDDLDTENGSVTFTCFEDKPDVDLNIQMEVNR